MIDPAKVCLFIPGNLKKFKLDLFNRIAAHIEKSGGRAIRGDYEAVKALPDEIIPVVGGAPELADTYPVWKARGRKFITWDRGYCRRVFASALPWAPDLERSFYRFHVNAFQMQAIRPVPDDRWKALGYADVVRPWQKGGRHIVIAAPSKTYAKVHRIENWIADTIDQLARVTDRQLVIRDKESCRNRPLQMDLDGAHALVTHGSIAAVESVILGCPVFVHPDSAASLVGLTDLSKIENPVYPDRQPWLNALAYSQFNETELVDGSLWAMLQ